MVTRFALPLVAAFTFVGMGCAEGKPRAESPVQTTSVAAQPAKSTGNISVSGDIAQACKINFDSVDRAPKFNFDDSSLAPQDKSVLQQVATCVTTGPLKGRSLKLVGRADPRGEVEYNFALGEHRAGAVESYLAQLGVKKSAVIESSRGKLDATGTDEASWQRDRRVDISLQ